MEYAHVIERLDEALTGALPGFEAQALMAPRPRRPWPPGFDPARARDAAALLLTFPLEGDAAVILTLRSDTVRHRGQVSLPGGVVEPGESYEHAALREAHEEVGLDPTRVRTIGPLTPIDVPVSGFRLHPVAAACDQAPELRPSDGEVAQILQVKVADLLDPARLVWRSATREGTPLRFPAFSLDAGDVWGATAMVLAEFLTLLGWRGAPSD